MPFKFDFPVNINTYRLEYYCHSLGLNGVIRIWGIEGDEDKNLLGMVNRISPAMVIEIKPTQITARLEGRIAHEITHISLTLHGYRNLCPHPDSISDEIMYEEFLNQFSNFLHHQVLYPMIINAGFTLEDDIDIVTRFYSDPDNINKIVQAYCSQDRFAKAWVIISLMNDLIRLGEQREILYALIRTKLPIALTEAEELLQQIGTVYTREEYEHSKQIIEQRLNIPKFSFDIE